MKFRDKETERYFLDSGIGGIASYCEIDKLKKDPSLSVERLKKAFGEVDFPEEDNLPLVFSSRAAAQLLKTFYHELKKTLGSNKSPNHKLSDFCFVYRSGVRSILDKIRNQQWFLVADLYDLCYDLQSARQNEFLPTLAIVLAKVVHILLGSEDEFLAGTKDNIPSWKKYHYQLQTEEEFCMAWTAYSLDSEIRYIGREDIGLVPDIVSSIPAEIVYQIDGRVSREEISNVIRSTYYDQKYILDGEGYKITFGEGYTPANGIIIKDVTIKRKSCLHDSNAIDILALFSFQYEGQVFQFLNITDGAEIMNPEVTYRGFSDLDMIACVIYKHLVTADRIIVGKNGFTTFFNFSGQKVSCKLSPITRRLLQHKRPCQHPVRGHIRNGMPMSAKQLAAVKDFERKWGVNIIDHPNFDKTKQTIVLPFDSPKVTDKMINEMPQFVIRDYLEIIHDSLSFKIE